VYKHTCPNGKSYIGITNQPVELRWQDGFGYKDNVEFFKYIVKVGWNNIEHEILYDNLMEKEAKIIEKNLIEKAGEFTFNKQHKRKENKQPIPLDEVFTLLEIEILQIWAAAIYGKIDDESCLKIYKNYPEWRRLVVAFGSGDKEYMRDELNYLRHYIAKLRGITIIS